MDENLLKYGTPGLVYDLIKDAKPNPWDWNNTNNSLNQNYYQCSGISERCTETNIYVAQEYLGKPVVRIKKNAFQNNHKIVSVYLPNSINEIQEGSFNNMSELRNIRFPQNKDLRICYRAIITCPMLQNIEIYNAKMHTNTLGDFKYSTSSDTNIIKPQQDLISITIQPKKDYVGENYWYLFSHNNCPQIEKIEFLSTPIEIMHKLSPSVTKEFHKMRQKVVNAKIIPFYEDKDTFNLSINGELENFANLKTLTVDKHINQFGSYLVDMASCPNLHTIYLESFPRNIQDKLVHGLQTNQQLTIYINTSNMSFSNIEQKKAELINLLSNTDNKPKVIFVEREDLDFIGFTYCGVHNVNDLNIYRVSDDMYSMNLRNGSTDTTAAITNGDGLLYFGSTKLPIEFSIKVAFDNIDEVGFRKIQETFNPYSYGELIFDEEPYKAYNAKLKQAPQFNVMCFEINNKNIYKGEGTLQFICYDGYGHSPDNLSNAKYIEGYSSLQYPTLKQWTEGSRLPSIKDFKVGQNFGDQPCTFIAKLYPWYSVETDNSFKGTQGAYIPSGTEVIVGNNKITIEEKCFCIEWNSKTGLVLGKKYCEKQKDDPDNFVETLPTEPIRFSGNSLAFLPLTEDVNEDINIQPRHIVVESIHLGSVQDKNVVLNLELDYQFWYY